MVIGFVKKISKGPLKGWTTNFKEKILDGRKKHTIRIMGKRNYRKGMLLQLAHGVRTKYYDCFLETECTKVDRLTIASWNAYHPKIMNSGDVEYQYGLKYKDFYITMDLNGRYISTEKMKDIAINDGFESLDQMIQYFDLKKGEFAVTNLIHWK